ncbi:HAMP domain-containing sensor histidine kinase [uncultured Alistipes sp.]|uniref:sensor histidine kinase n=1 Tax=uncultured Alistipes sp. TaxID=538949 RepID=UPI00261673AB|nr:HAMP domain-containing sensor histidine kinase [uncultured Alistipes sp.]
MLCVRHLLLVCCALLGAVSPAVAVPQSVKDSLQHALAHTEDPATRIQLLLNLKDLNEETNLNLPYSIRLFREAAAVGDTYAMSIAVIPILSRYSTYVEKEDSLKYYVAKLRELTPGTPEEGAAAYAEMNIGFGRLRHEYGLEKDLALAHEVINWSHERAKEPETIYERAKRLLLHGYANLTLCYYEQGNTRPFIPQTDMWREAYDLTSQMPNLNIRRCFASIIYFALSGAYNQAYRYDDQVKLTNGHIAMLDKYYAADRTLGRRPYLYSDNSYVRPYQQLLRCALNIGRNDYAEAYFEEFRRRMLSARGENLLRNKSYLYELGYLWKANIDQYEQSILYSDSLISLTEQGKGYFRMQPGKIYQAYRDRSVILSRAKHYDEAFEAFERTMEVQDSILSAERHERLETIRRRHDMDKRKLAETRAVIRNRAAASFSFVVIVLLMLGTGIYLLRSLLHNRRLKSDILRQSRKAQESEHMKSTFVNTICRGIGPPFNALDAAAYRLMLADADSPERTASLASVRENTEMLLSTLDNMLEAANLDSLTGSLQTEPIDIDGVCRAELLAVSRLPHSPQVAYSIEAPGTGCIVHTHVKYFAFVVRALLDNARKFTQQGRITLRYELDAPHGRLCVSVTDTGCGIPSGRREEIFRSFTDNSTASPGLSLALCRLIAGHLSGSIRLDESYTKGTRFIFTIPVKP